MVPLEDTGSFYNSALTTSPFLQNAFNDFAVFLRERKDCYENIPAEDIHVPAVNTDIVCCTVLEVETCQITVQRSACLCVSDTFRERFICVLFAYALRKSDSFLCPSYCVFCYLCHITTSIYRPLAGADFIDQRLDEYESGGYAVGTTRKAGVGIAVTADTAEGVGVDTIGRTEPPPSGIVLVGLDPVGTVGKIGVLSLTVGLRPYSFTVYLLFGEQPQLVRHGVGLALMLLHNGSRDDVCRELLRDQGQNIAFEVLPHFALEVTARVCPFRVHAVFGDTVLEVEHDTAGCLIVAERNENRRSTVGKVDGQFVLDGKSELLDRFGKSFDAQGRNSFCSE